LSQPVWRVCGRGDNPSGADNQQERPGFEQWVVGFVDGESCFSISVGATRGAVSAGSSSTSSRYPRLSRHVMRWSSYGSTSAWVHDREQPARQPSQCDVAFLCETPQRPRGGRCPVFENHPLVTAKAMDFRRFPECCSSCSQGEHLGEVGLRRIAALTEQLNRRARSRYLESSEAIRQPCRSDTDMKIWS